jgi:carbon monoxide dehydrogenase subunit G
MPRVEASVEVAAPRDVIWGVLADPSRYKELGTLIQEVKLVTDGELREGAVYRERSGVGIMKSWREYTISRFDPPREMVHVTNESSMSSTLTWTLTELNSKSTRVTQLIEFEVMPRLRPLGRLIEALLAKRMTQRETDQMLQGIKRVAEGSGAA